MGGTRQQPNSHAREASEATKLFTCNVGHGSWICRLCSLDFGNISSAEGVPRQVGHVEEPWLFYWFFWTAKAPYLMIGEEWIVYKIRGCRSKMCFARSLIFCWMTSRGKPKFGRNWHLEAFCIPLRVSPTDFRPQAPKTIPFCYHFVKQVNLVWRHFVVLFLRTFSNGFSRSFRWYPCRGTFHQIEIEGSQKKASLTKL